MKLSLFFELMYSFLIFFSLNSKYLRTYEAEDNILDRDFNIL